MITEQFIYQWALKYHCRWYCGIIVEWDKRWGMYCVSRMSNSL